MKLEGSNKKKHLSLSGYKLVIDLGSNIVALLRYIKRSNIVNNI